MELSTFTTAWLFGWACCWAGASLASNYIMTGIIMLLFLPVLTLKLDQHRTFAHISSSTPKINLASSFVLPLLEQSSSTLNASQGMYACNIQTYLSVTQILISAPFWLHSLSVVIQFNCLPVECGHSKLIQSLD